MTTQLGERVHEMQCLEVWGGTGAANEAASVPGMDFYIFSEPYHGENSGGDIYLISMCGAGRVARFVLADVAGHGTEVSELAHSLGRLLRKHIGKLDQTQMARALNEEFTQLSSAGRFATALLVTYFAPTDHLIVLNAGHPPPLWYRASTDSWAPFTPDTVENVLADNLDPSLRLDIPLGVVEPTRYTQIAARLDRGDLIVLYSDALIEATSPAGEQLGLGGLLGLLGGLDPSRVNEMSQRIRDEVRRFRGNSPADDDLTLIVLHHNAAPPPPLSISERLRVLARMMGIGRLQSIDA